LHCDILEQQSGVFGTVITLGLAICGQRKVTRQTINKPLKPALRITFQANSSLNSNQSMLFHFDGLG